MKTPRGLSAEARRLWRALVVEYRIEDERAAHLLTLALEQFDAMRLAQASIKTHGALVIDRYNNPKQNPAVLVEARARRAHLTGLREALRGRPRVESRPLVRDSGGAVVDLAGFLTRRFGK